MRTTVTEMIDKGKFWQLCRIGSFLVPAGVLLFQAYVAYVRSEFGRDELCGAAYAGNLFEMRLLLNAGADPSRVGWEEHFTPLGETVRTGQEEAARLLLAWGADPNVPNDRGFGSSATQTARDVDQNQTGQEQVIALLRSAGGK